MSRTFWNYDGLLTNHKRRYRRIYKRFGIPKEDIDKQIKECGIKGDIKDDMEDKRDEGVLCYLAKGERSPFVLRNIDQFKSLDCYEEAVIDAYTTTEYPLINLSLFVWKMIFNECDSRKLQEIACENFNTFSLKTVYRAAIPKLKKGMSWTGDIETAEFFRHRCGTSYCSNGGRIYTTEVGQADLAFYTNGRKEDEFVLHPDRLDGLAIEEVKTPKTVRSDLRGLG